MIAIHPLAGIGEVRPGGDLVAALCQALRAADVADLAPCDVLVVTQRIVSKSENRFVDLAGIRPSGEAVRLAEVTGKDPRLVELVLSESTSVVRATCSDHPPPLRIRDGQCRGRSLQHRQHRSGPCAAGAGRCRRLG